VKRRVFSRIHKNFPPSKIELHTAAPRPLLAAPRCNYFSKKLLTDFSPALDAAERSEVPILFIGILAAYSCNFSQKNLLTHSAFRVPQLLGRKDYERQTALDDTTGVIYLLP
jgi:hypothetical protein